MDLVGILKDKAVPLGRFAQSQFMVWIAVLRNPRAVVSRANLRSKNGVMPALRLAVFAYALTLVVALPKMFLYQHVDVSSGLVVLMDFVATALAFCLLGLTLYAAGKLLGGRGRLLASMIAGLYLAALWPIIQVTDYVLSPDLPGLGARGMVFVRAGLLGIVAALVLLLFVVKASPVVALVHGFGRVRGTIGVLIQALLMFVGLFVFLRPLFEKLAGKP